MEQFINLINSELRYKQQFSSLRNIMSMIESYEVVDFVNEELDRVGKRSNRSINKLMIFLKICLPLIDDSTLLFTGSNRTNDRL